MVKHPPAMWETQVQSLGQEDLLEKEMATHASILAWRILWTEKPVGYSPWACKELGTTERLTPTHNTHPSIQPASPGQSTSLACVTVRTIPIAVKLIHTFVSSHLDHAFNVLTELSMSLFGLLFISQGEVREAEVALLMPGIKGFM